MSEGGGTSNQSGILYQDSVAALYLGRLCDPTPRPDSDAVIQVQDEASNRGGRHRRAPHGEGFLFD